MPLLLYLYFVIAFASCLQSVLPTSTTTGALNEACGSHQHVRICGGSGGIRDVNIGGRNVLNLCVGVANSGVNVETASASSVDSGGTSGACVGDGTASGANVGHAYTCWEKQSAQVHGPMSY